MFFQRYCSAAPFLGNYDLLISGFRNPLVLKQGRRNRGDQGGHWPPLPEFLRLSKVQLSQSAPSNQGLTVLAPPDFFTFRRPCSPKGCSSAWGCLFGCENLLNFICHIMKFYKCHHTNQYETFKVINKEWVKKKEPRFKNWALVKDTHFSSNLHETW